MMRETRLYDYATPSETILFQNVDIAVPTRSALTPSFTPGTWTGLYEERLTWRVEEGSFLIIEDISNRQGLRFKFSSHLTCRPLMAKVLGSAEEAFILTVACYADRNGCSLLRISINASLSSPSTNFVCEEVGRLPLLNVCVTGIINIQNDVVIGFSDGRCALVKESANNSRRIELIPFAPSPSIRSDSGVGENTSMVSLASSDSVQSNRSIASSMSFGLRRFFASPRSTQVAHQHPETMATDQSLIGSSGRSFRESLAPYSGVRDKVLALAPVKMDVKAIASLHESGRVCIYTASEEGFHFGADVMLPMKLSSANVDHFLLTGPVLSAIAVVMVDEDPSADSLRIYNIAGRLRQNSVVSLSCTQIARRDGPVGRVVSAAFTGDDVIVGTDLCLISGVLNVPSEFDSGVGIPSGTLWTAVDDVDKPFALGRTLDQVFPITKDQLCMAHRFSTYAVAKALRLSSPASAIRADIQQALEKLEVDSDEENYWKRLKSRSEQITMLEDMKVRDILLVEGVGVVVTRRTAVYILRNLSESERKRFGSCSHLLSDKSAVVSGKTAAMLSSNAAFQELGCRLEADAISEESRKKYIFMLKLCTKFSDDGHNIPLTDVIIGRSALQDGNTDEKLNFSSALFHAIELLAPGAKLLRSLLASEEMQALIIAAEQSANVIPISAMFAGGIAWLAQYRKESAHISMDTDINGTLEDIVAKEDDRLNAILHRAYGLLMTASKWCKREKEEEGDSPCAISLASLSNLRHDAFEPTINMNLIMTDNHKPLSEMSNIFPNGPYETIARENLDFWLLERSVRLLERSGAANLAAAAAMEAMACAPDRKRHEMMRAAAFSRFLDAGELKLALSAILHKPYEDAKSFDMNTEESGALRDAIGLFVNATADRGMLQWLANYHLPEPLHTLCGHALERRARAADALQIRDYFVQESYSPNSCMEGGQHEEDRPISDYELLYAWYILRNDEANAATSALEWSERLEREGLGVVRALISGNRYSVSIDKQLRLLLSWAKLRCDALALASSAAQLLPVSRRYIARSRFSLLAQENGNRTSMVVEVPWVSRRHLLTHAQSRCLKRLLSELDEDSGAAQTAHYLLAESSPCLAEKKEGVRWVVTTLSRYPSYDNMLLSAELCSAWTEEIGDSILVEVVQSAASFAAEIRKKDFEFVHLKDLLLAVASSCDVKSVNRNWFLLALESTLSTASGSHPCPQWLVDAAAWGSNAFGEDTPDSRHYFAGRNGGDAAGVVRAFLRNNLPIDAAKVLLTGLGSQKKAMNDTGCFFVPYSAIDATIETLSQIADEYPGAEEFRVELENSTKEHISRMEDLADGHVVDLMMGESEAKARDALGNDRGGAPEVVVV